MAAATDIALRQQVMYSVFVRNYSKAGNFEGVRRDLRRIKDLGVDIIWLMPIHPIGEKCRKGRMGSPYAIKDFRAVNPDFGTEEDLRRLVGDAHGLGMKVIIDVVYNHTSPDSVLAVSHPEWFYHKPDGSLGNRIGEWYDVVDLDYRKQELWDYQIDTLKKWAGIVDGLAESIHRSFLIDCRANGIPASSDAELYQAFDICYDYDIYQDFRAVFTGSGSLGKYLDGKRKIGIVGMLADKDVGSALSCIAPLFDMIFTTEPSNPRKMSSSELRDVIMPYCSNVAGCSSNTEAYKKALSELDDRSALVIFGSLYLASDMRKIVLEDLKNGG